MAGKKTGKRLLTWVLVLVMALSLLPLNALADELVMAGDPDTSRTQRAEENGAHLVKSATKDGDTYQIQLESWVTGKVEQTTGSAPLDIVLVLDQSGSMEGEKLSNLKAAVTNFVAAINADADAHNVEHRIAIVGFASNGDDSWDNDGKWENTGLFVNGEFKKYITYTSSGYGEVYVLDNDKTYYVMQPGLFVDYAVKVSHNSEEASWGYWKYEGFHKVWVAVTPKENEDDANDSHTQFYEWREGGSQGLTDQDYHDALVSSDDSFITTAIGNLSASGATRASYDMEMANNVFANNERREGSSRVVVFFTDGEPGYSGYETDEAGRAIAQAHATKNNPYNAKVFSVGMFDDPSDKVKNFMNYVSSNYPDANASEPSYIWDDWTITSGTKDADKYYMTVENGDLSAVFKTISGSILTPNVKADANTVLTDTLSQYFDFDGVTVENGTVTGVTVQKQKYNGDGQAWGVPESVDNVSVALDPATKTVTVSGFDYSAEENVVTDNPSGYKLVVTFNVKPDTNCTNWGASDKYATNSGSATLANDGEEPFATVASPKAFVETYQVTYKPGAGTGDVYTDQYYLNGATRKAEKNKFIAPDGYKFNCWKDEESGQTYNEGADITFNGKNVTLTAQWKTKTDLSYTVNYLEQGTNEVLHKKKTTGNQTFGTEIPSSKEVIDIDGYTYVSADPKTLTIGTGENVINLYYTKRTDLSYTVNYLEKDSNKVLHDQKVQNGMTFKATVNSADEKIDIDGYNCDSVDKETLTIGTGENVINLYYTKRTDLSYTVKYVDKNTGSEIQSSVVKGDKTFGDKVTGESEQVTIANYTYVEAKPDPLTIGTDATENVITLYYTKDAPTPGTFDFNDVDHSDDKATPAITKTVKGNVGKNFTEAFYVTVKGADEKSTATMATAPYTGKAEVIASKSLKDVPFLFKPEVMANAVVPYGELRFTEAGTYTYTVREEVPGKPSRMSYDTTEYTLTIEVVLNENANTYQVKSWQFTAGNSKYPTPLNIVNTYRTYHPSTPSKPTLNTGDHYAYVMGYPDGTVRPNGSITRAEVSAILFRLLSDKTRDEYFTTESSFTDVKAGAWYNNSIATLEKAGVIVDTAKGGAFRPNEAITRAELAAMLAQFSDAKPVKGVKFSDVSAEHWAYEAIAIAAKMGWIEGYPDGTFRPDATITRAEMMTLVNRALERVPSDEDHLLSKRVMLTFPDCKSGDWFYIAVQEATNSHTYERAATEKNGDEQWTALRANRDWTLLEK